MSILSSLIAPVTGLISEFIPDGDKKLELETKIKLLMLENEQQVKNDAASIVLAEAKSEHFLTSTWRPILALVITFIVAMHYAFFPILNQFLDMQLVLDLPEELWTLLQIMVGGYVIGRSGEKMVDKWKK